MGAFGVFAELTSLLLCIGAIVTNALLLLSCDLWKVESLLFEGSLGLFSWQVPGQHDTCVKIENGEEKDFYQGQILLCARWSAVTALSLGGLMFLLILFQQYLIPCPCTPLLRDICAIGTQICLGLVYTTYFSRICTDFECHYGQGTLLLIITQSLWAVAGVLSLCMRPGRHARARRAQNAAGSGAAADARRPNKPATPAQQEEGVIDEEARDKVSGLEAGLAKYPTTDDDGGMSETSSLAVGMSVNPDEDSTVAHTNTHHLRQLGQEQEEYESGPSSTK